jgi:hypothetical protein
MPRQSTDKSFFSKRNPRLTSPRDCRVELARAYKSWLVGQIQADDLKCATFVLNVLTGMMKGIELEHQVHELNRELNQFHAQRRSNGHANAARR